MVVRSAWASGIFVVSNIRTRLSWGAAAIVFESATNRMPLAYAKPLTPPRICWLGRVLATVKVVCPKTAREACPVTRFCCAWSAQTEIRNSEPAMYFFKQKAPKTFSAPAWQGTARPLGRVAESVSAADQRSFDCQDSSVYQRVRRGPPAAGCVNGTWDSHSWLPPPFWRRSLRGDPLLTRGVLLQIAGDFGQSVFQNAFEFVERDLHVAGKRRFDIGAEFGFEFLVGGFGIYETSFGLVQFLFGGRFGLLALLRFEPNFGFSLFGSEL